ncbi:MAG: tRNA (adenosine(37)-N6)-threonylcarbamoyltransferase complex ATPase subunit type 1 TsaE [Candidatus Buchananbacteria bacterium]|nr:tRNA (adenosine(37)-N6)-threonylcarbamoyltransferase complex ATPase subunit type 1 TsaE [Candidatus Buchananbacteria bacterium]
MKKYILKTEKEIQKLVDDWAGKLKGGEIIALEGDLGAGKTTFSKYLAKSLRIKKNLTSPTFVLMKIYKIGNNKYEIRKFVHVDCYRLDSVQELFYLGIEEYLNKADTVVVIEWADKIKNYLQKFKKVIWIKIEIDKNNRIFIFK